MAATEDRLKDTMTELDEKMDRLEAYSRRQNLKFFEIPMSDNDNRTGSVQKVLQALPTAMPGKNWSEDHTVRAHRLGSDDQNLQNQQNGQERREKPMVVRFTRWQDKTDILTDGREGLRKQNIKVLGDLTKRQRSVIEDHRQRGRHDYYSGSKLVVTGPLCTWTPAPMSTPAGVTGMAVICSEVKTSLIGTGTNCSSNTGPTSRTAIPIV